MNWLDNLTSSSFMTSKWTRHPSRVNSKSLNEKERKIIIYRLEIISSDVWVVQVARRNENKRRAFATMFVESLKFVFAWRLLKGLALGNPFKGQLSDDLRLRNSVPDGSESFPFPLCWLFLRHQIARKRMKGQVGVAKQKGKMSFGNCFLSQNFMDRNSSLWFCWIKK